MKFAFRLTSGNRAVQLSIALTLLFASTSLAEIQAGTTYDFASSATANTTIFADTDGLYTIPAGAVNGTGFCVGPTTDPCGTDEGMSGSYFFTHGGPTGDQITFQFAGGTDPTNGDFTIDLSNFVNADGSTVTNIAFDNGSLSNGSFNVAWNAGDATFTGTPDQFFAANGPKNIVFDITETSTTPEPGSLLLGGLGLAGLAIAGIRRRREV